MKWTGLWHRASEQSGFHCLHMVAWEALTAVDVVGVGAGKKPDGSGTLMRFFIRLDEGGDVKHLVLENQEVITGRAIAFDKLDPRILAASKLAQDFVVAMHESEKWEIGQSLVLRGEPQKTLRQVSATVLAGGESMDPVIRRVVDVAQIAAEAPLETGESVLSGPCPTCNSPNDPKAKFCGECGAKLGGGAELPSRKEVSSIALADVYLGLAVMALEIGECKLEGPDEYGYYAGNISVRVTNTSGHDWVRAETSFTIFNYAGIPIASDTTLLAIDLANGEDDTWSHYASLSAAQLRGKPERLHLAFIATAYAKQSYTLESVELGDVPDAAVSLGNVTIPSTLAVVGFDVSEKATEEENSVFFESRCFVQNISSSNLPCIVEAIVEVSDAKGEKLAICSERKTTPGHYAVSEIAQEEYMDVVRPMTAKGIINVMTPVSYGSIQRQGAVITSPDESADEDSDDNDDDASTDTDMLDSDAVGPRAIFVLRTSLFDLESTEGSAYFSILAEKCHQMRSAVEEHLGEDSKTYLLSVKPSGETPWFKFGRFRLSEEAGVLEEKMQSRMGNTFSGPADQTDLYFAVITSATDPWNNEFLAMSESIGLLTAFGAHDSHEGIVSQGYEDGEFDTGIVVSPDADDDEYGIDLEQNEEELSEGDFDLSNYGITTNADGTRSHDSGETSEQNRSTVEAKIETEKRTFERNAADRIQNDFVVTLNYSVADADGNIVDAGDSPLIYLHGGYGGIFKRVESALEGKRVGDKLSVTLAPEDAFGDYDADLVTAEPRSLFPDDIEVGMQFERPNDDGENVLYTVTAIEDDSVVVDSNHPLSGLAITFSCTVSALRPATSDESAQGHVLD